MSTHLPGRIYRDDANRFYLEPSIRSTSAFDNVVGKPLTNARINYYAREGRYGKDAQQRAVASVVRVNGTVEFCKCGAYINVRYMNYSYLPQPGYWCPKCRERWRAERDKEREYNRRLRDRINNVDISEYC